MEINAWYTTHRPTLQHLSAHSETSSNHELVSQVCGMEQGYMCCNAGYLANGRGIMTPVDTRTKNPCSSPADIRHDPMRDCKLRGKFTRCSTRMGDTSVNMAFTYQSVLSSFLWDFRTRVQRSARLEPSSYKNLGRYRIT